MKALLRRMAVLLLVSAFSSLAHAATPAKGSSSGKGSTASKAKVKAKAKPKAAASEDDESDATPKPKATAKESDDDSEKPKTAAKPKPADDETPGTGSSKSKNSDKNADDDERDGLKSKAPRPAAVTSINVDELAGFGNYPKQVRSLVESAVALTHLGLTYTFGSSEPNQGGMDCSGTMYHVLRFQGLKDVPRQSDEMCAWVRDRSRLHLTPTAEGFSDVEFEALRPGDLLFWTGTMETSRKLPVTHVMLYLGKLKSNGKRVVFGSSDGRTYEGNRRCGVSVFDFSLPKTGGKAAFYGYGPAPGLATPEALALEEIRKAEVPTPPVNKPLIDGEELFAAKNKNADQPQPLPQAEVAAIKPATNDEASTTKKLTAKNKGEDQNKPSEEAKMKPKPASSTAIDEEKRSVAAAKPEASDEASTAKKLTAKNRGEDEDKPSEAKTKPKSASSTTTAKAKTTPTSRQTNGPVKKSTSGAVAQRTPARKKPVPESTESKPAKVVREVVDSIRGAFRN